MIFEDSRFKLEKIPTPTYHQSTATPQAQTSAWRITNGLMISFTLADAPSFCRSFKAQAHTAPRLTVARVPWVPSAPTLTFSVRPANSCLRGASAWVKSLSQASQRSCGLKTLPTPVSGIASSSSTCTGMAARSGVRSRTQACRAAASASDFSTPGLSCT